MKRLSTICFTLASVFAAASLPLAARAQQPAPKPPVLEKLEEGEAPAVTIRPGEPKPAIKEKREQGRVTQVEVQSGGSHYVVKANDQPGSIQPGEGQSTAIRVPQWQILEFDLGMRKEKQDADKAPAPPEKK